MRSEGWRGERWWWWGVCQGGRDHKLKLLASRSKFPIESDLSTVVNVWVKQMHTFSYPKFSLDAMHYDPFSKHLQQK